MKFLQLNKLIAEQRFVNSKILIYANILILLIVGGQRSVYSQKPDSKHQKFEFSTLKTIPYRILNQENLPQHQRYMPDKFQKLKQTSINRSKDIAEIFLRSYKHQLGLTTISDNLKIENIRSSPAGDHIIYREMSGEYPVYNSCLTLTVNHRDQITFMVDGLHRVKRPLNLSPRISPGEALKNARNYLEVSGFLHAEEKTELMIVDTKKMGAMLAYRVQLPVSDPLGDWEIIVDVDNGDVLQVLNGLMYQDGTNGSGKVWEPDPLSMAETYYGQGIDPAAYQDLGDGDHSSLNDERIIVTLNDLSTNSDGDYILEGPHLTLVDLYYPDDKFPALTNPDSFIYLRSEQAFEHVMVYYHVDQAYRRMLDLGFGNENLKTLRADPHADPDTSNADISFYSPAGNFLCFGVGGVDDAEDACVIWHEYGHAIQNYLSSALLGWPGETFSLLEGDADYWAASYMRRINDFAWQQLYLWDAGIISPEGEYTFWAGRRCDLDWHYPEDYYLYDGTHKGGQIWSSALMNIWTDLGADITDALFLQSHYYWSERPGFVEAAESFMQADRDLYDGVHLPQITYWFDYHGFIDKNDYQPLIIYNPRPDTEDLEGPYNINCQIVSGEAGIDTSKTWVVWQIDSVGSDSSKLFLISKDYFLAQIPGSLSPSKISYYISVQDSTSLIARHPEGAPDSLHVFLTGPDTIAPEIYHQELDNQPISIWPVNVSTTVMDNLGIDTVWVVYKIGYFDKLNRFALTEIDSGMFEGSFNTDTDTVEAGDTIYYKIIARDKSENHNVSTLPEEEYISFNLFRIPPPPDNVNITRSDNVVGLAWQDENPGLDLTYNIYRKEGIGSFSFHDSISVVTYTDSSVEVGSQYFYYLTAVLDGWESHSSDTVGVLVEAIVGISEEMALPQRFSLSQNYPNPFNPVTMINYQLPLSNFVELTIFNLLGQRVATIVSKDQQPGHYQVQWDASGFPSGIYYYRLQAGSYVQTRKLILLR